MKPVRVGAALLVTGAFIACTVDPLNPQPLPPSSDSVAAGEGDAGSQRVLEPSDGGYSADVPYDDAAVLPQADAAPNDDGGTPDASTDAGADASDDGGLF